jgi:WXG100 family type VII secretion target
VHGVGRYTVDPAELRGSDELLGEAVGQSRAALGRVRAAAAQLQWQGGAASAFRLGWEQWLEGALAMLHALDEMAIALGATADRYASTDDGVRASISRAAP